MAESYGFKRGFAYPYTHPGFIYFPPLVRNAFYSFLPGANFALLHGLNPSYGVYIPVRYPPAVYPQPAYNYVPCAPPPQKESPPPEPSPDSPSNWLDIINVVGSKGYYWVDWTSNRTVPPTAVLGGVDRDGSQIFVGRAYHEGDWIPAKVIPQRQIAYIAYGGAEHGKHEFQLLCEQRFDWIANNSGYIPQGAVEGGRTDTGETLYIGRVWHDGAHTVGKVHPSHGVLYIPYDGRELAFQQYEILVLRE